MDALGLLIGLKRRVESLERRATEPRTRRRRAPLDEDSAAILRYLHSNQAQTEEDRDIAAITTWLKTPKKRDAPVAADASRPTLKKGE